MVIYDIDRLKQDANPKDVAEYIGMSTRRIGSITSILCPAHNDTHHGSCQLTAHGYRCYVCGAKDDVIDMVRKFCGVDFASAAKIVAEVCGGEHYYLLDEMPEEMRIKIISPAECNVIGLYNAPVYTIVGDSITTGEYGNEEYKHDIDFSSIENNEPRLLVSTVIERNPLRALFQSDPDTYYTLIRDRCEITLEKYYRLLDYTLGASFCDNDDITNLINDIIVNTGKLDLVGELQRRINEVEKIATKHCAGYQPSQEFLDVMAEKSMETLVNIKNSAFLAQAPF